ncbi:MAG TPA: hypothetical protein VGF14_04280 [Alphaproteobacteria bacterium]
MSQDPSWKDFRFTSQSGQSDQVGATIPGDKTIPVGTIISVDRWVMPIHPDRDMLAASQDLKKRFENYSSDDALKTYVLSVIYEEMLKRQEEQSDIVDKFKELIAMTKQQAGSVLDKNDRLTIDNTIQTAFLQP